MTSSMRFDSASLAVSSRSHALSSRSLSASVRSSSGNRGICASAIESIGIYLGSIAPIPVLCCVLMSIDQVLALLIEERDKLTRAIEALQGPTSRRGRPSKNASAIGAGIATPATPRKRRGMSPAARRAASARMRAYWAAKPKKDAGKKS